jgi:hypothetical protein
MYGQGRGLFAKVRYYHETGQWDKVALLPLVAMAGAQYEMEEEIRDGHTNPPALPQYTYYNKISPVKQLGKAQLLGGPIPPRPPPRYPHKRFELRGNESA